MSGGAHDDDHDDGCECCPTTWLDVLRKAIDTIGWVAIVALVAQCASDGKVW